MRKPVRDAKYAKLQHNCKADTSPTARDVDLIQHGRIETQPVPSADPGRFNFAKTIRMMCMASHSLVCCSWTYCKADTIYPTKTPAMAGYHLNGRVAVRANR